MERPIGCGRRGTPGGALIRRIRVHRFGQITRIGGVLIVPIHVHTAIALVHRDVRRELRAIISGIAVQKNRRSGLACARERAQCNITRARRIVTLIHDVHAARRMVDGHGRRSIYPVHAQNLVFRRETRGIQIHRRIPRRAAIRRPRTSDVAHARRGSAVAPNDVNGRVRIRCAR